MPAEVRESADQAIDARQNARPLPPKLYQSLGGTLAVINEISTEYGADLKADHDKRKARREQEESGP